jgi:hypothetical protein
MSLITLASVLVLYPMTLFGDACILVAVALAATVGGRPLLWGASFAAFHALYGIVGILITGEVAEYSEQLGDVFVLCGAIVLLRHFMHHRLHHYVGGDCSCEHHQPQGMSTRGIISTASAFSLHSLASGAIVRQMTGDIGTFTLIVLLIGSSVLIGALLGTIVLIGDRERLPILRALDKLPGFVTAALTGVCGLSVYHLLREFVGMSGALNWAFVTATCALAAYLGIRVHYRNGKIRAAETSSVQLTGISPSKGVKHNGA